MNTIKFDNVSSFNEWRKSIYGVIIEFGKEIESPTMYPCIVVYEFIEHPYLTTADEDDQFDDLIAEGYDSDDIEKLIYHFIYPTDFD